MSVRLYVAHLHEDSTEARLKDIFSNYGSVAEADKAIEALNGTELDGNKIKVEIAGGVRDKAKPVKRFDLRVLVEGLGPRVSWQDLKDWARQAGDVTFTNVFTREGIHMGVVEFKDEQGLEEALKTLPSVPMDGNIVKVTKDDNPHIGERRGRDDRWAAGGRERERVDPRDFRDNRDDRRGGGDRFRDGDRYPYPPPPHHHAYPPAHLDHRGGGGYPYPPPAGYYPPPPRYDDRGGYGRYSDDYRRDGPPIAPPPYAYRGRSRSRSRERRASPPPYYPPPHHNPHFRPGFDGPPPPWRFEDVRGDSRDRARGDLGRVRDMRDEGRR